MAQVIHLITAYLNTQKRYLDTRPLTVITSKHTSINFIYYGYNIEVCIYNDTFIKLKVDDMPYAICDGIKTFRSEIDRLHMLRHQ